MSVIIGRLALGQRSRGRRTPRRLVRSKPASLPQTVQKAEPEPQLDAQPAPVDAEPAREGLGVSISSHGPVAKPKRAAKSKPHAAKTSHAAKSSSAKSKRSHKK